MNSKFAYLLATAVENKKMKANASTTKFIEKHGTTECSLDEVENTPEINDYLKVFYSKKMKCNDKQLAAKFEDLFSSIKTVEKPVKVDTTYRAQEY